MAKNHSENKKAKEISDETFLVEETEIINPKTITSKDLIESKDLITDDNLLYNAEVIGRFGKTSIGTKIVKKGSIIKILLDKNLIKLI